jgi:hypothetical protein
VLQPVDHPVLKTYRDTVDWAVMPRLVSLGRVGFRPTPYDWVPLAVIILLIVIFVGVYSGGGRSRRPTAHQPKRKRPPKR